MYSCSLFELRKTEWTFEMQANQYESRSNRTLVTQWKIAFNWFEMGCCNQHKQFLQIFGQIHPIHGRINRFSFVFQSTAVHWWLKSIIRIGNLAAAERCESERKGKRLKVRKGQWINEEKMWKRERESALRLHVIFGANNDDISNRNPIL